MRVIKLSSMSLKNITHWNKKYSGKWQKFIEEQNEDFKKKFQKKKEIAHSGLLVENLEFILNKLLNHCKKFNGEASIRNVLFFFYTGQSKLKFKTPKPFSLLKLNYSQKGKTNNFINLD